MFKPLFLHHKRFSFRYQNLTGIGFGSKETTTPAISVILCCHKTTSISISISIFCFKKFVFISMNKKKYITSSKHLKNVTGNPQLISSRDANRRANLEFPLLSYTTSNSSNINHGTNTKKTLCIACRMPPKIKS
jgi:hypothetical protein